MIGSLRVYTLMLVCTDMLLESMYADGRSYSCVCWECTLMLGGEECYFSVLDVLYIIL